MSSKYNKPNPARALLVISLIASIGLPLYAQAQQEVPAAGELQSVIVTGTYSKNRRTVDSESPIDIISARDLQSTGSTELATVLSRLVPSLNFARPSGADASDAVRPAQLRGLSPDQTLVLVNGKRRYTSAVVNVNGTLGRGSAPVDLNAIPLAAIDHIEVLRDGAAAQYGSDAIAGVINIILKKGPDGNEIEVGYGQYQEHDGKQKSIRGSTGFALGDRGWVRVALDLTDRDPTNRAGADFRNPKEPRYGQVNQRYGDSESKPRTIFVNSQYTINDNLEWYGFGSYGQRDTSAAATWRTAFDANGNLRTPVFPEGFLPLQNSKLTDQSLVTGLRGEAAGWRWDTSVNYGSNLFELDLDNTVNLSLGANSPTHFYAGKLKNSQALLNLDVARDFAVAAFTGPLTVALGAETRHEKYEIGAGELNSYVNGGSQGFSGFQPGNAGSHTRHNESLYLNLEAEITKKFSAAAALRHERYSDFGNTTSAKGSARYAFNDVVSLRGTASSGFRAPSLAQQYYTITTTNFQVVNGVNTPIETGTFAVNTPQARALGAQDLKPEKARNYSLGLQLSPTRNFNTTIDAYRIDIDNRILFSSNLVLNNALKAQLAAQGSPVGAARYFNNAIDTRTTGVDVVSTYRVDLKDKDRLDFTVAYNHNNTSVERVAPNPALLTANGLLLVDRQSINRATVSSPKDKLSLATDYTFGLWNAHGVVTRYGKFTVPQNDPALDQTYDTQWVLDLSGSVKLSRNWKLSVGIDNVTNRYPAQVTSLGNLNVNGTQPYSIFAPNGFNGRYYYAKAAYNW
ncbi:TonB-dependent receptor plug domain-containing protein [Janthinobacterium agaricidamnosum]|uniref:TonB-dependent Receptor Plug domain protein n=1 Tax=Janthinobacterium agaricidamnosum NBRC 102515 = DSM 9628 TaxID=1349767 RepID=W0V3H0_9BURK|nr:TonB-dependent receptor [Janthinobacterium agaricidamnosum]CDG81817.1 tonB-dependent Receptor Plug domain protein [Janthinobacterium agaricidamnosum NBRC 102515 = DSM 9628]